MSKEKTLNLLKKLSSQVPEISCRIDALPALFQLSLLKCHTDLLRSKEQKCELSFTYNAESCSLQQGRCKMVGEDKELVFESWRGGWGVRVVKSDKELWIESFDSRGFKHSLKVKIGGREVARGLRGKWRLFLIFEFRLFCFLFCGFVTFYFCIMILKWILNV
jgi:hypothetical protein